MSHTKNGKLIGQAAHAERKEQAQYVADVQEAERKRRRAERDAEQAYCRKLAGEIRDAIGERAYNAWWKSAPDDNAGFIAAVETKHAEVMPCECSADDRDGACSPCRARNAHAEMPF